MYLLYLMVGIALLGLVMFLWIGAIFFLLTCLPGVIALVLASYIPKRFRYLRIVVLSTIAALLLAPTIVSIDKLPTLRPIIWAIVDPRFSMEVRYNSMLIWGIGTWIGTALLLLWRSRVPPHLPDANDPRNHAGPEVAVSDATMLSNSRVDADAREMPPSAKEHAARAGYPERKEP